MTTHNNNSLNNIATNLYGDNQILDFNFPTINTNEMFKKQDGDNITGTKIYSTGTNSTNKITMTSDISGLINVGTIEGERDIILNTSKLHINATGTQTDGITITSDGKVGIGVVEPEEDLEIDGNIQLDTGGVQRGRVIFYDKQNDHEHAEVDGLGEGNNGGVLAFYTKVDGSSLTEKLRINNVGAIGIGGANYGSSGQVLTSNGSGSSVSWESPIPYHLVFGLSPNSGNIYYFSSLSTTLLTGLFVRTGESTTTYNNDLTSGTYWSPSVSGIFQINAHAIFAAGNTDQLAYSALLLEKSTTGSTGTFTPAASSTDRRYGSNQNATDAQAFANTNNICHTFKVETTDTFRLLVLAITQNNINPSIYADEAQFKVSITKVA